MIKVYRSKFENDEFYLNKNNSLLTTVELFDNNKPKRYKCSIEKWFSNLKVKITTLLPLILNNVQDYLLNF